MLKNIKEYYKEILFVILLIAIGLLLYFKKEIKDKESINLLNQNVVSYKELTCYKSLEYCDYLTKVKCRSDKNDINVCFIEGK